MNTSERKALIIKARRFRYRNTNDKGTVLHRIGEYWSKEEVRKLANRFLRNLPLDHIARFHKRDIGGVLSRMETIGLIWNDRKSKCYRHTVTKQLYVSYTDVNKYKDVINQFVQKMVKCYV